MEADRTATPFATATPVVVDMMEAGGTEQQQQQPDNDERWSLIWGALIIYWAFDALLVFLVAFAGFIATLIFYFAAPSECSEASTMFILSTVIFLTKFTDIVLGCCTIGCWFCSRNTTNQENRRLLPHIRNCILVCSVQCLLSLASIAFGILGLMNSPKECAGASVSIVFAVLLIMDAAWELFIWIGAYVMRIHQHEAPIPSIVDKIVPDFLFQWARRTRL